MNPKETRNKLNLSVPVSVSLRRFPYPYKAAIAICSDIDLCSCKAFIQIHRFLNSSKHGLGLPVADSFFGSSMGNPQLGYIDSLTLRPGFDAPFIREAIKAGLIDTIHGWGDFNDIQPEPNTIKSIARMLVEDFAFHELKVPVWINHGSLKNHQNFYCRKYSQYFTGDDPQSPLYTADLLHSLGIRYIWMTENVSWPLSAKRNLFRVTQLRRKIINATKNYVKQVKGNHAHVIPWHWLKELCVPFQFRDGSMYTGFSRCNPGSRSIWHRPKRSTIHHQLTSGFLDLLERSEGYVILYQHLGYPVMTQGEIPFTGPDLEALKNLATRYHNGRLWVAPTAKILDYWNLLNIISWEVVESHQGIDINIKLNDSTISRAGLTFYTHSPSCTRIMENGTAHTTVIYPPDSTGLASIGVPLSASPSTDLLE